MCVCRCLYKGYQSLYEMDYGSFTVAGQRVFDMDNMLGSPSAKVMARMITTSDTPTVSAELSLCILCKVLSTEILEIEWEY